MKLQLTFPPSYYSSTEKIRVIKSLRCLFDLDLPSAKFHSEQANQSCIFDVNFKSFGNDISDSKWVDDHKTILKENGVVVKVISDGFSKKIKELISDAVNEDEFQLAIDLINVYRNNFK